jgi:hypothetical protein
MSWLDQFFNGIPGPAGATGPQGPPGDSVHITVTSSHAMTASNTAVRTPIFQVTGTVQIFELYGIVTAQIGANHTVSEFDAYDGTNLAALTLPATVPLSGAPPGSLVAKLGAASVACVVATSTQVRTGQNPSTSQLFDEAAIIGNNAATTSILYAHTTTDTPESGTMLFTVVYKPLSPGASVVAV